MSPPPLHPAPPSPKALLTDGAVRTMDQAVDAEALAQTVALGTRDLQEAIAAFLEKREPRFRRA